MCLHIQFPRDMCTIYVLYFFDLHSVGMFNSLSICARILYSNLLDYFLDERPMKDAEELTGEYESTKKCLGNDSNLP